jgi:hypothetical protein
MGMGMGMGGGHPPGGFRWVPSGIWLCAVWSGRLPASVDVDVGEVCFGYLAFVEGKGRGPLGVGVVYGIWGGEGGFSWSRGCVFSAAPRGSSARQPPPRIQLLP